MTLHIYHGRHISQCCCLTAEMFTQPWQTQTYYIASLKNSSRLASIHYKIRNEHLFAASPWLFAVVNDTITVCHLGQLSTVDGTAIWGSTWPALLACFPMMLMLLMLLLCVCSLSGCPIAAMGKLSVQQPKKTGMAFWEFFYCSYHLLYEVFFILCFVVLFISLFSLFVDW